MFRLCQTVHVTSTAYHPQSQGLVERSNRSLLNVLRVLCSRRQNDWHKFTQSVAFAYNTSVHATTKVTPNLAMTGSEKTTPMEFMFPDYNNPLRRSPSEYIRLLQNNLHQVHQELVRRNTEQAQVRHRTTHDKRIKATQYNVGDYVTVFVNVAPTTGMHKLTPKWTGPYQITKVHDDGATYTLNDTTRVHYDRLKYYHGRPSDWHVDANSAIHIQPDVGEQQLTQTIDHDIRQPPFVEEHASHASDDTHLSEPDRPSQVQLRSDEKHKQTPLPDFLEDYQEQADRTQQCDLGSEISSENHQNSTPTLADDQTHLWRPTEEVTDLTDQNSSPTFADDHTYLRPPTEETINLSDWNSSPAVLAGRIPPWRPIQISMKPTELITSNTSETEIHTSNTPQTTDSIKTNESDNTTQQYPFGSQIELLHQQFPWIAANDIETLLGDTTPPDNLPVPLMSEFQLVPGPSAQNTETQTAKTVIHTYPFKLNGTIKSTEHQSAEFTHSEQRLRNSQCVTNNSTQLIDPSDASKSRPADYQAPPAERVNTSQRIAPRSPHHIARLNIALQSLNKTRILNNTLTDIQHFLTKQQLRRFFQRFPAPPTQLQFSTLNHKPLPYSRLPDILSASRRKFSFQRQYPDWEPEDNRDFQLKKYWDAFCEGNLFKVITTQPVINYSFTDFTESEDNLVITAPADFNLKFGLHKHFSREFGHENHLFNQKQNLGGVAFLTPDLTDGRFVFYLITTTTFRQKIHPRYLTQSLLKLRLLCHKNKVTSISLPRLGEGYDGIFWPQTEALLHSVFEHSDITVTVHNFYILSTWR